MTTDWMQTYTGRVFYPLAPEPSAINPADSAHALSLICRYGGHVDRLYSVAEHCVLMSEAVTPENALWALLHDATEAYLGDMIRPLKQAVGEYRAIEWRMMKAIVIRFGIDLAMPAEVQMADSRILLDERAKLMARPPRPWWGVEQLRPLGVDVLGWEPKRAEYRYLDRLQELTGAP